MPPVPVEALDKEELRHTIAKAMYMEVADIGDEQRFIEDLEVDSLMALEVAVVLEKRYGVRLRPAELQQITCLNTVYDLMRAKLGAL